MSAGSGGVLALLDTLTFPETLTILVVALVVLGPEKLPGMARTIGKWMTKVKRIAANLESEMRDVVDDPVMKPLRELGEFAAQPKRKLAEYALAAEAEVSAEQAEAIMSQADDVAEADGATAPDADAVMEEAATVAGPARTDRPSSEPTDGTPSDDSTSEHEVPAEQVPADDHVPSADSNGIVEPVRPAATKIVATGPNHPMERLSPLPPAADS